MFLFSNHWHYTGVLRIKAFVLDLVCCMCRSLGMFFLHQELEEAQERQRELQGRVRTAGWGAQSFGAMSERVRDIQQQAQDVLKKAAERMETLHSTTASPSLPQCTAPHCFYCTAELLRHKHALLKLNYITCHLAAFIQSDLQLIRLSRRHTPWSNVGLRALLKGPTSVQITVVQILSWPHQGSNHRPCSSTTPTLQAAPVNTLA